MQQVPILSKGSQTRDIASGHQQRMHRRSTEACMCEPSYLEVEGSAGKSILDIECGVRMEGSISMSSTVIVGPYTLSPDWPRYCS